MKTIKQYLFRFTLALLCFVPAISFAQNQSDVEMADAFRAEGKIYVVIAVMTIILAGLFFYLFTIAKKVRALEKKISEKK